MALTDDPGLAPPDPRLNGVTAPPHNLEAEQSVLGAILLSERSLYALVIEEGLRPEDFYRERHRITYAAMLRLYAANDPIDPLTVTEALRQSGELEAAGGAAAIDSGSDSAPKPEPPEEASGTSVLADSFAGSDEARGAICASARPLLGAASGATGAVFCSGVAASSAVRSDWGATCVGPMESLTDDSVA